MSGLKNQEFGQFARIAGNPPRLLGGVEEGTELICDEYGRLIVVVQNAASPSFQPQNFSFLVDDTGTSIPIIGTVGLRGKVKINGYNDFPSVGRYLHIYLIAPPIPPASVPFISIPLPAGPGAFILPLELVSIGGGFLTIAVSSTQFTFTPVVGSDFLAWGISE